MAVRMDELCCKVNDKKMRKYTQTWARAPTICTEIAKIYPSLCRELQRFTRYDIKGLLPRRIMPKPLCNMCSKEKTDCRHVYSKCKCPAKYAKERTSYPSYSECKHCRRDPYRKIEFRCLDRAAMCVAW